ncbi:hypothetical protein I302_100180 [Kwoniella bestiolae CBS 10118]|uniref:DUF6534 domain-containing protein n=1 Tax=Kwoniella bestiolae CBS 10118 TaxID=1296100 RepID=A0A1B9G4F9_9TREE|nr:hypothetical protein I302_03555 [Kwoniella bestiolae CBS 10118]OCF25880.1 hypothetical protein I302_03555 [Kwoniella bestiolae CBS 10118]
MDGLTSSGSSTLNQLIDEAIFQALQSSARSLTWYCALGLGLEGIVLGAILSQVYRYYEHFRLHDTRWTLAFVALGTCGCIGQFGLNLWQTYMFIDKAATAVYIVLEKDVYADMTVLLFVGIYNLAAAFYFSRRAIKLRGHRRTLVPTLGVLSLASFAICLATVCTGFRLPSGTGDLKGWITNVNNWVIAWTAVSVATDLCVCATMTYALIKSKDEIKAAATSLMRKLLMLTFETMLPPVTVTLLLLIFGSIENLTMGNFSRVPVWMIGPLYFHSIIHSLVSRHDVQFILEQQHGQGQGQGQGVLPYHFNDASPGSSPTKGRYEDPDRGGTVQMQMQMMPVVVDQRARKELGWEEGGENEFGVGLW